jgi:hypothetical protein
MNEGTFETDVGDIRKQLIDLHEREKKILEGVIVQLKSTKKDVKMEKNPTDEDLLSLEMKQMIAKEIKREIAKYKNEQRRLTKSE